MQFYKKISRSISKVISKGLIASALCALLISNFNSTFAEEEKDFEPGFNWGLYLGGNLNMHSPNFANPYLMDSTTLMTKNLLFNESSSSLGLNAGLLFNVPLNNTFTFSGRLGFNGMGGDFDGIYKNTNTADLNDTTITSTRSNSVNYVEISPMFQFHNLLPVKKLYFLAGLELGIPVSNSYSEDVNTVITDKAINTEVSNSTQTISDAEIAEASMRVALGLGVGYTFELKKNLYLSPELSYRIPFSNVSSAAQFDSWSVPQLRFGVNLTFGYKEDDKPEEEVVDTKFQINQVQTVTPDSKGNKVNVDKVIIEDVQYTELFPIVPMVFFDANQSTPSEKTTIVNQSTNAGEFNINNLESDAVSINKSILDVLGKRLQDNPSATLTITGTNDGLGEKNNKEIALKRAEFVKDYFVKKFNIDPSRLKVNAQGLPTKASSTKDKDGIDENRRVEFSSNINDILAPIMIEKDKQTFATPIVVEFLADVTAESEITSWEMTIEQSDRTLSTINGTGKPENITWNIQPNELKANDIPIDYTLLMKSNNGKTAKKIGTLPVEYFSYNRKKSEERPDKIISKYSLIVFDFDSPEISDFDKYILDKNVLPNVKNNSTVQIYGYSDRIGDEKYNQKLSTQRAQKVEEYLKSKVKSAKFETYGLGENIKIYDNDLTVGRQLSRTVQIYVITPKQ